MIEDSIVEEVHKTRERLLEEHGGIEGLIAHLREFEAEVKDRVVILPPRSPIASRQKVS